MTVADKILFTCTACAYKARIPSHYSGRSIHCPKCKTVQEVGSLEVPGQESSASRSAVASDQPAPGEGKIVFTCSECSYKGRLSADYDGKTIRCPGCQKPQTVVGEPVQSPIVASLAADETVFRTGELEKIRFECGACGYRARIPGKYAGKPIHCPQCKEVQQVNPETDLEAATGRTVVIAKVSQAQVREAKLAMTNVGVSFSCAVCGYASKISPSCAGDAIYCPSCRSPQKVEWGDPDEVDDEATDQADQAEAEAPVAEEPAPPVAPPSATAFSHDISNKGLPVLPEAPVAAPVADAEPEPLPGLMDDATQGESPDTEPAMDAPEAPPAALTTSGAQRVRRSVRGGKPPAENAAAGKSEPASEPSRSRPAREPAETAPAKPASKMPLVAVSVLFLIAAGAAGVLFMQTQTLKTELADQMAATKREADAKAAAEAARDAEKARGDAAETEVGTLKLTLDDAKTNVEKLSADLDAKTVQLAERVANLEEQTAEVAKAKAEIEALTKALADAKAAVQSALPLPK